MILREEKYSAEILRVFFLLVYHEQNCCTDLNEMIHRVAVLKILENWWKSFDSLFLKKNSFLDV